MPRIIYRHEPATRFIVSAIGEPGQRQFFLQVKSETGLNAVTLEKGQVVALTERFEDLVKELRRGKLASAADLAIPATLDDQPMELPIESDFTVGVISISWENKQVVVNIQAATQDDELVIDDLDFGPDLIIAHLKIHQVKGFCLRATTIVNAGRPQCPFCALPVDPRSSLSTGKWVPAMTEVAVQIQECELIVVGRLVDASNATLQANLKGIDPEVKVIYKPVAGERPLWDFEDGNLAHREYAAFLISDRAGFDLVPHTVLREGPFGFGMVQQWIEIDGSVDVVQYGQSDDTQLRTLALFDAIINNTDRKFGHLLIDENGKLRGCDHGVCFHQEDKLRTVLWQFSDLSFSQQEIKLIDQVEALNLEEMLVNLLTKQEIAAIRMRIKNLKDSNKFPLPSDQWPAVPWPPV